MSVFNCHIDIVPTKRFFKATNFNTFQAYHESGNQLPKTDIRIQCLDNNCNTNVINKTKKAPTTLKSRQKIIITEADEDKTRVDDIDSNVVTSVPKTTKQKSVPKKGVEDDDVDVPADVSTEDNKHVNDLNKLLMTTSQTVTEPPTKPETVTTEPLLKPETVTTESSKPETVTTESSKAKATQETVNDTTPNTSLLVGVVFGCILLSVVVFVGFKRLDAIRRRREYARMNDFLIDGMYNEL